MIHATINATYKDKYNILGIIREHGGNAEISGMDNSLAHFEIMLPDIEAFEKCDKEITEYYGKGEKK